MQNINRTQLFRASCLSLLVTSLSFGIRAGILNKLGTDFQLDKAQLASITATAFWGFPLAVVIGGIIVDLIGMKKLLVMAFVFHLAGILLTIFAQGYWTLFFSTLLVGLANGTVEAACNPLVTSLYPETKNIFFSKERDLTFEFVKKDNKMEKMIVRENGNIVEEVAFINK